MSAWTPGPWRWTLNLSSKSILLVGGRPMFDKTVMQFGRWGMSSAAPLFNGEIAGDRYNVMYRVTDRDEWHAPLPGREHHADWCQAVVHPDASLMAASPDLADALQDMLAGWRYIREHHGDLYGVGWDRAEEKAVAALARATGDTK